MPKKAETVSVVVPEAEQPYKIPDNWRWVRLSALASPSKETTADFSAYIRYVGLEHMETGRGIVSCGNAESVKSVKNVFHDGQILYGKLRPYLNKHDIADFSGVCSTDILVFEQTACSCAQYVNYYFDLPHFLEYAASHSRGINLPRVTKSILLNAACPLPPLAEQQRIVDRIESLFAKLDEAREKAREVVDGFELRKAAILYRAFSGELTAQWRESNGVSLNQWFKRALGDCGAWNGGGTPSMKHPEYWEHGDLPWITPKDMKSALIEDSAIHVNMAGVHHSSANYVTVPSVLFVVRSGILRHTFPIAMVKRPFTVNQDLKALSPHDMDLNYLFWACKSCEKKILESCMKNGTTVESINTRALMAFQIPVAPKKEQREIVRRIEFLLSREEAVKASAETVIAQISTMKKAILGRAFRGELGTNDPSEASPDLEVTPRPCPS